MVFFDYYEYNTTISLKDKYISMPRSLTHHEKLIRALARAIRKVEEARSDLDHESAEQRELIRLKNSARQGRPTMTAAQILNREIKKQEAAEFSLREYEQQQGLEQSSYEQIIASIQSDVKSKEKTGGVGRPKSTELDILEASIRRIKIQDKGNGLSRKLQQKLAFLQSELDKKIHNASEYERMYHVVKQWKYKHRIKKSELKKARQTKDPVIIQNLEIELQSISDYLVKSEDDFNQKYGKVTKKKLIKRDLIVDFAKEMTDVNIGFYLDLLSERKSGEGKLEAQEMLVSLQKFGGNLSYAGKYHFFDTKASSRDADYSPMQATFKYSHEVNKEQVDPYTACIPSHVQKNASWTIELPENQITSIRSVDESIDSDSENQSADTYGLERDDDLD